MATESNDTGLFVVVLVAGVGLLIWYMMRQQSLTANALGTNGAPLTIGPANASQVAPGIGQTIQDSIMSSIPVVGPLTYPVNQAGLAIVNSKTLAAHSSIGTYTDTSGHTQNASLNKVGILGATVHISNRPIYDLPGGAEVSLLATGGLSAAFSSRNRSQLAHDLEFWKW